MKARFLLLAIPVLLVVAPAPAAAQHPCVSTSTAGPFCIEGAITPTDNSNVPPQALFTPDPTGVQELGPANAGTTKVGFINYDAPPTLGYTSMTPKVDLTGVFTQTGQDPITGDTWFYFAWTRATTSGSGFLAIEFDKSAPPAGCTVPGQTLPYVGVDVAKPATLSAADIALINGCNPFANRQEGDFMLLWDQTGNSIGQQNIFVRFYHYTGDPKTSAFGPPLPLSLQTAFGVYGTADASKGEMAANLSNIVQNNQNCLILQNIIPTTVTGNSDTADYKDTVLSAFPIISTGCGLTVDKVTKKSDGTLVADSTTSFTYTVSRTGGGTLKGTDTAFNDSIKDTDAVDVFADLNAATDYTLVETNIPAKYALDSIVCTDNTGPHNITVSGTFAVGKGFNATCVITNKQKEGTLIVLKHVTNTNGGNATAGSFTLNLNDGVTAGFAGNELATASNTFKFEEGHTYNVSEGALAGYVLVSSVGDCSGAIVANTTRTCTLTNDDIPPVLTLVKSVHNQFNGGKTPADFTLTATGPTTFSGLGPQVTNPGQGSAASTFQQGAYTLTESQVVNYSIETDYQCSFGSNGGSYNAATHVVTIGLGQSATCTIVNTDAPASLKIVKKIINNNGGTKAANDFGITTNAGLFTFGGGVQDPDAQHLTYTGTTISNLSAGTYSLHENDVTGYAEGSWSCTGNAGSVVANFNTGSVQLANGETVTCTITNDDDLAAPTAKTVQRAILHDTANITGIRPGAPNASAARVTFTLYKTKTGTVCSNPEGSPEQVTINGSGVATTVNGVPVAISATTIYYWVAAYTGDAFNLPYTTACGDETTQVVFTQVP